MACLLVPGLHAHLAHYLAVAHLQRRRAQDLDPVRVLARLHERHAALAHDLVLAAVGHFPAADVAEVPGDLLLAAQDLRGAGGRVLVDGADLGVVGVEAHERLGVAPLYRPAQGPEVQAAGGPSLRHRFFLLAPATSGGSPPPRPYPESAPNARVVTSARRRLTQRN